MECRDVLHDLIPDVGQLEFGWVHVEEGIFDPNEHCLLDDTSSAMYLSTPYRKLSTLKQCP